MAILGILKKTGAAGGTLLLAGSLVWFYSSAPQSAMPRCIWKLLTGLQCPGCGSQRFVQAMLKGKVAEAVSYNYLLVALVPLLIWLGVLELLRKHNPALYARCHPSWLATSLIILLSVWTIARNLLAI